MGGGEEVGLGREGWDCEVGLVKFGVIFEY